MLLEIKDLKIEIDTERGTFPAVDGISLNINAQEIVALVGESGCGKSVTALSILSLLPKNARISRGGIFFNGLNLSKMEKDALRSVRGGAIGMIFQEPMTALNPVIPVGKQIIEVLEVHEPGLSKAAKLSKVIEMLGKVGIDNPTSRYHQYPHELSGGMRQRVMIAIALICHPKLLIADEPTTALDVTIQAQILNLLKSIQKEFGLSVLLITHDLGIVSEFADRVSVMYSGRIVEEGIAKEVLKNPLHPYTKGLIRSIPRKRVHWDDRLQGIPGMVPGLGLREGGCQFKSRCEIAVERCALSEPELEENQKRRSRCFETKWEDLR